MPPSQTERPSPGFTTIVGSFIFDPLVFLTDVFGTDAYFTPAHGHDRNAGGSAETVISISGHTFAGHITRRGGGSTRRGSHHACAGK
jgi:hypothetical protein